MGYKYQNVDGMTSSLASGFRQELRECLEECASISWWVDFFSLFLSLLVGI